MGTVHEVKNRDDWNTLKDERKKMSEKAGEIEPLWPQLSQELLLPRTIEESGGFIFKGIVLMLVGIAGVFVFGSLEAFRAIRMWQGYRDEP